ncbi:MAG TPA: S53 family peptidase [Bryobacteraceae bacterium]|nr:S53 family peptidase [Bryobacteraceae bacterium]
MSSKFILRGSYCEHPSDSAPAGSPAPSDIINITLVLRRRTSLPDEMEAGTHLSHENFVDLHGAADDDILAVEEFATANGFSVVHIDKGGRSVTIQGSVEELASLFEARVQMRSLGGRNIRSRAGYIWLPAELKERVVAVLGFEERPVASTYHRRVTSNQSPNALTPFTPIEVAKLYSFPQGTGANQTIALIELGGGFKSSDLQKYWKQIGVNNVSVTAVSVDGAKNAPVGDPNSADAEVVLDIEVAGGVAPGARIAVYFAPNTDQGFLDAINAAIHDTVRKPSVISISWGAAESEWTSQAMDAFNAAFQDAATLGITVCAAAGDNGSSDGESGGKPHVDFPASSPWVLACGGTRLQGSNDKITSETVWNDGTDGGATGGGVSAFFTKPSYQNSVAVPKPNGNGNSTGRGVPDVAGVADPETGYEILVDGQRGVVGGTSAVAPLWAGLIALINSQLGKNVGWFHPTIYGTFAQHKVLHDITSGNNGTYKAGIGWDACTGYGTPNGQAMLNLLKPSAK